MRSNDKRTACRLIANVQSIFILVGMKMAGIILIVLGAIALAYQGFSYSKRSEVLRIGDASVSATTKEHVNVPPWAGFVLVGVGVALTIGSRRTA